MTNPSHGRIFKGEGASYERLRPLNGIEWSDSSIPNYADLGIPFVGGNFLFAFDYDAPKAESPSSRILFIYSARLEQCMASLARLMQLYQDSEFVILKRTGAEFPIEKKDGISFITFAGERLSEEFFESEEGLKLEGMNIGPAFFCMNHGFRDHDRYREYLNVTECLNRFGFAGKTYGIDGYYRVFPLDILRCWTKPRVINGRTLHLPLTLLFQEELEELYDLAANGPSEGAIINIGHFLGGSPITLAKGSKSKGREKVYSFDIRRYNWADELFVKNGVEDWLFFQQADSLTAAEEWGRRPDSRIRLLLIDGDHLYEACKNDITS